MQRSSPGAIGSTSASRALRSRCDAPGIGVALHCFPTWGAAIALRQLLRGVDRAHYPSGRDRPSAAVRCRTHTATLAQSSAAVMVVLLVRDGCRQGSPGRDANARTPHSFRPSKRAARASNALLARTPPMLG